MLFYQFHAKITTFSSKKCLVPLILKCQNRRPDIMHEVILLLYKMEISLVDENHGKHSLVCKNMNNENICILICSKCTRNGILTIRLQSYIFKQTFVAGWLQGHWWGFIIRNYLVWPTFLLMNVFIALKGSHFWFLFQYLLSHLHYNYKQFFAWLLFFHLLYLWLEVIK